MIFDEESASDAQKNLAPPKNLFIDFTPIFFLGKNRQTMVFGVQKWNVGNHLKRVLAKFRANRSHVRGPTGVESSMLTPPVHSPTNLTT